MSLASELPTAPAIAAIVALAAAALLAVWLIPRYQRSGWERSGVRGKDLADMENSARSTLVQLLGGVALILTFVATWLQIADTRKATDRTLQLTAAQQETERFTRAVEQLGSKQPEVRLGGMYGLQQAARDTPGRRRTVAELMIAYLQSHHPLSKRDKRLREIGFRNRFPSPPACVSVTTRPWPDTQAALSVLLNLPRAARPRQMELSGVDLIGVRIEGADFRGARLRGASLAGASLPGAIFDDARLHSGIDLRRTCLRNARFRHALIGITKMAGADLSGADLAKATLDPGALRGAVTNACTRLPDAHKVPARCKRP